MTLALPTKALPILVICATFAACSHPPSPPPARPEPTASTEPSPPPAEPLAAPVAPQQTTASGLAPGGTGLAACDAYVASLQRYAHCDKLPPEAREAFSKASAHSYDTWQGLRNASPEQQHVANEACKQAEVSVEQSLESIGCPAR
jgi:hypothetical protein